MFLKLSSCSLKKNEIKSESVLLTGNNVDNENNEEKTDIEDGNE